MIKRDVVLLTPEKTGLRHSRGAHYIASPKDMCRRSYYPIRSAAKLPVNAPRNLEAFNTAYRSCSAAPRSFITLTCLKPSRRCYEQDTLPTLFEGHLKESKLGLDDP